MFSYTVACTFDSDDRAHRWINWLREGHLAEVCAAGALDAEVIRVDSTDPGRIRCEVRYHFASREDFAVYEREHAPRLRAAGGQLFPPGPGMVYERSIGEVITAHQTQAAPSRPASDRSTCE